MISIEVADVNRIPVLDQISDITVQEGDIVSFAPTGTDPDGDLLTYNYSGWMTSQSYTTVSGDAGVHVVTVTVTDGVASSSQDVTITVENSSANLLITWKANPETDLAGYKLYSGISTGIYDNIINVANITNYSLSVTAGVDIFFAVTAYDTSGNESGFSSELLFNSANPSPPAGRVALNVKVVSGKVSDNDKVHKEKEAKYKKSGGGEIDIEQNNTKHVGIVTDFNVKEGKVVSFGEKSEDIGINRWKPLLLRTDNQYDLGLTDSEGMPQISGICYAPSNPNTIYIVTKESQVWKSRDGGNSWKMKNNGFIANGGISISVDPNNEDVVFVAGLSNIGSISNNIAGGIYRTKNGGKTWELVKQTSFKGVDVTDFKTGVSNIGGANFDFSRHGVIYAGTHEDGLLRSLDGGGYMENYFTKFYHRKNLGC